MCIAQELHSQIFKTHDIFAVCATCTGDAAALILAAVAIFSCWPAIQQQAGIHRQMAAARWTFPRSFRVFTSALCQRFLRFGCGRLTANSLVPLMDCLICWFSLWIGSPYFRGIHASYGTLHTWMRKNSKKLPTLLPFVLEFRVMYLSFSDQLTGKELQSILGYPSMRQAPFILFTAARKYRSWELVRRKRTPSPRLHPSFVPRGVLLDQGMYVALFVGLKCVQYLGSCKSRKMISADTPRAKTSKGRCGAYQEESSAVICGVWARW